MAPVTVDYGEVRFECLFTLHKVCDPTFCFSAAKQLLGAPFCRQMAAALFSLMMFCTEDEPASVPMGDVSSNKSAMMIKHEKSISRNVIYYTQRIVLKAIWP